MTKLQHSADDKEKLADLKAAIQEAETSGDFIDADRAFELIRAGLRQNYPQAEE